MRIYVWTVVSLFALVTLGKLVMLGLGETPPRTQGFEALDVFLGAVMIAWGTAVLANAA
jgi:hypothetical protein